MADGLDNRFRVSPLQDADSQLPTTDQREIFSFTNANGLKTKAVLTDLDTKGTSLSFEGIKADTKQEGAYVDPREVEICRLRMDLNALLLNRRHGQDQQFLISGRDGLSVFAEVLNSPQISPASNDIVPLLDKVQKAFETNGNARILVTVGTNEARTRADYAAYGNTFGTDWTDF